MLSSTAKSMAAQPNQPNPSQVASAQANTQIFYNAGSSIHGIGSFARVGILRGRLIHSERPFLYLCSDENPVLHPQEVQDPQWQTWLGLRLPGTPLPEIFRTTSIRCGLTRRNDQQVEASGVFLQAARFNSSCQPNVHAHWNHEGGHMEFRALRDILVDEELYLCYDPPTLLYSTVERRQRLLTKFGFYCNCTACIYNPPGSDQWRMEARRTIEAGVLTRPPNAQAVQNRINQIIGGSNSLRAANLYHYAETLYFDLHLARSQAGDTNGATLCLLTARNLSSAIVGRGDPRVRAMTAMLPTDLRDEFTISESWALAPPTRKGNDSPMVVPSDKDVDGPTSTLLDSKSTPQGAPFLLHSQFGSFSRLIPDLLDSWAIGKAFEKVGSRAKGILPIRSSFPKAAHGKLIKTERGRIRRVQSNGSIGADLEGDGVYRDNDGILDLSGRVELCQLRPVFNGQYSAVYQGKIGLRLVAVKVLKEIHGAEAHTMQRKLDREKITWASLRHRNVLPLCGFANDHEDFQPFGAFISPWRQQGNARQFLEKQGKDLSVDQRLDLWKGVVAGVAYLHNHKPLLVHGDLKAVNILIDDHDQPQLCDFGLISILLEEGNSGMTTTSQHTGTDRYLAYELLNEQMVLPTTASDIYALGCTGLEFYFSQIPHARHKNNMRGQIFTAIKAGTPPATRTRPCDPHSEAFWDLLDRCWTLAPGDRPKAEQLLAELQLPPFATTWTEKDLSTIENNVGEGLSG